MPKYKWDNPLEWLEEKITEAEEDKLRLYALLIAKAQNSDQIQEVFGEAMAEDGYFQPLACDMGHLPKEICPVCNPEGHAEFLAEVPRFPLAQEDKTEDSLPCITDWSDGCGPCLVEYGYCRRKTLAQEPGLDTKPQL